MLWLEYLEGDGGLGHGVHQWEARASGRGCGRALRWHERIATRKALTTWFAVLSSIDRRIDPRFEPDERLATGVLPPWDPKIGRPLFPIDPEVLSDPVAREE